MKVGNKAIIAAIIGDIIFGFSYMFSKSALSALDNFVMLAARFTIAVFVMTLLILFNVTKFDTRKNIKPLVVLGLLQPVLYFTLETYGISMTNSVIAGSIIATVPIVSMVLSALVLKESFSIQKFLFALISLAGVVLISIAGQQSGIQMAGIFVLFAAVLAGTTYSIVSRKISSLYTPFERTYIMFVVGMIVFSSIALIRKGNLFFHEVKTALAEPQVLISLFYLSIISSVVGFYLKNYALNTLSVAKSTSFAHLSSVVSMVAGAVFLREPIGLLHIVGCVIILIGVVLSNGQSYSSAKEIKQKHI